MLVDEEMKAVHTVASDSLDDSVIRYGLVAPINEIGDGIAAEHIVMGGDEEEETPIQAQPRVVNKQVTLNNRIRGLRTELTFYEEGFLKIREARGKNDSKSHLLNLQFLGLMPRLTRRVAMRTLYTALGLSGVAGLAWLIAEFTSLARFFGPIAVVFGAGALLAFLLFVYRTRDRTKFFTAHGEVEVVTLLATLGCYRRCRAVVPEIRRAIEAARANNNPNKAEYLREEMRDHYRLRESGVISPEACAEGTRRILSQFD